MIYSMTASAEEATVSGTLAHIIGSLGVSALWLETDTDEVCLDGTNLQKVLMRPPEDVDNTIAHPVHVYFDLWAVERETVDDTYAILFWEKLHGDGNTPPADTSEAHDFQRRMRDNYYMQRDLFSSGGSTLWDVAFGGLGVGRRLVFAYGDRGENRVTIERAPGDAYYTVSRWQYE